VNLLREHRDETGELQRVAETLLAPQQQGFAAQRFAIPSRCRELRMRVAQFA
jgi:hypothetical protein